MPFLLIGGVDLIALLVGLAVLLILGAGWVFFRVLHGTLKHVPFIGGSIAGAIESWLGSAIKDVAGFFDTLVHGVAHLFWALSVGVWNFTYGAVQAINDAKTNAVHAFVSAVNVAAQLTWQLFNVLNNAANALFHQVQGMAATIESLPGTITHDVAQGVAQAEGYASSLVAGLDAEILGVKSDVVSEANRVLGEAEAFTTSATDAVQSEAVRLFGQVEAEVQTLEGEIVALPGQIGLTIPGIVEGVVPGLIAGAIPGILAQVLPRVVALEGEATRCLEPLCDTVTPNAKRLGNLGNLFKGLEDLGIEALFIALAAECLTDPAAVVNDVSTVTHDVGDGVMQGFRDLIGA